MRGEYIDGTFGQVHTRRWGEPGSDQPPIICLPPSPFSGIAYNTLAPLLAKQRIVIAPDYPGYGNSDPTPGPGPPTIADYAAAARDTAAALSPDVAVDLLGFHTGSLVAVETALLFPERVNRLVLVDVPYFHAEKRAELLGKMGVATPLMPELAMLAGAWEFCVSSRLEHIPLQRAYELFIDQASAGESTNDAFRAAFSYRCEERFPQTSRPSHVVATKAGLFEPTCSAAAAIADASLVKLPEITIAVLEKGAPELADTVNRALS